MIVLSVLVAAIFLLFGAAKLFALAPMRERAAHAGFSVDAYRGIGALEIAGAAGLLLGLAVPVLGALAGVGLLLLLAGALVTHVRNHDRGRDLVPALVCALLVAGYLVALGVSP
ncbi:DoxX family protein [Amycolatopsis sp. SID8362]|uniref:DoxX family protein n=1 Tax=Amycolatopsis sp. SID8362 TaxID=2690346 RepID=UPI001371C2A1|nr:DoxX family protein [Amycolatopsis sp. SID8362]NBH03573.1 invasion protein [Amycolatopsis sp. SID8362]NED40274.1 invasion protein [Amycolatopsis sp. SID8362]